MTASILQQLLALYLAIIYSLQLGSGENKKQKKTLTKIHPYISQILQI